MSRPPSPPENLFDQMLDVLASPRLADPAPVVPSAVFAPLAAPAPRRRTPRQGKGSPAPLPPALDLSGCDLAELARLAAACTRCPLHAGRSHSVFADGSPTAKLMFIGEGPGRDEDLQGRPFVGRSGQLLDKMIVAMQFRREDVYIANIVKCRPPDNRQPTEEEGAACLPYLVRQIEIVQPKVLVLLGATAVGWLLGKTGVSKLRGHWHEFQGIPAMPTFHPAYLLRNPPAKKDAWADLKKVMQALGKPMP